MTQLSKILSQHRYRQIHDQQMVQVVNGQGTLQIPLMITDDIMEGVVCLLQGNWRDAVPDRIRLTTDNTGKKDCYGKSI
jgi:anaerobic selenocysteine-containing dehydrogenase